MGVVSEFTEDCPMNHDCEKYDIARQFDYENETRRKHPPL